MENKELETNVEMENKEVETAEKAPEEEVAKEEPKVEAPAYRDNQIGFIKSAKWKKIWDKVTTGLLILLMASPLLIMLYILMWFLNK